MLIQIQERDRALRASIAASMDQAVSLAAARDPSWIACRPGCTECCMGPFAITWLDAWRLREGLEQLAPERAAAVRARAAAYVTRIAAEYPGDAATGELEDEDALPEAADAWPCPALDPQSGLCELYEARPVMCRTFGPVTRSGPESFAACELCYAGASAEQMAACAVEIDPEGMETDLIDAVGREGTTIVAYALASREGAVTAPEASWRASGSSTRPGSA
ncbi:MAG: YkgJ family cysteine cluster protein [Bryobacteraceae bacterium]